MESPIDPGVFRTLFKVAVGGLSTAFIYSLYHQRHDMQSCLASDFKTLSEAKTDENIESALQCILTRLQSDAIKKDSASRLCVLQYGAALVKLLKLEKSGSNARILSQTLKIIVRVFGSDASGRKRIYKLGAFKVLLGSLSEAHRQGNEDLMEEVADALKTLTQVNDADVVLETDVPEGAEGAYALATIPATVKMLRILDHESPVLFLNALTGIFVNVCTLHIGAVNLGKGTDGHSGISFFFRLLDHPNRGVVENCIMVIRLFVRAGVGLKEVSEKECVSSFAEHLRLNAEPAILNSIITIILVMSGSKQYAEPFFTHLASSTIPQSLFDIWMRSPEKTLRNRCDVLCRLLSRINQTQSRMTAILNRSQAEIQERHYKDQQEYQRQMQQMQQSQFMQRMMLEQMGMDPSALG